MRVFFNGSFKRKTTAMDARCDHVANTIFNTTVSSLIQSLKAGKCELCGTTEHIEIHDVKRLKDLKGKTTETKSGHKIHLYANIGSTGDVASVLANDAEGIGLFRSEFIYLEKDNYPTEEEQFQIYKAVAQNMAGKKVIIRTLDIGADKQIDYFDMAHEENPAMGYRAIRICLDRPEVFKTQLRALFRASMSGNIYIMSAIIISVTEVTPITAIVAEVQKELT